MQTFHFIDLDDKLPYGLLAWAPEPGANVQIGIFDLVHGTEVVNISPRLCGAAQQVLVDVCLALKFVAIAQRSMLYVRSYNRSDKYKTIS